MAAAASTSATPVVTGTTNTTTASVKTGTTARLGKPWVVSDKLLPFLGVWENGVINGKNFAHQVVTDGFILTVYKDSRDIETVGCGHRVVEADNLKVGDKILEDNAKEFLKNDLKRAEDAVNKKVVVPLFQYEYDALVSIVFNAGGSEPATSLATLVNKGDYDKLPEKLASFWTKNGKTNVGRRQSESDLFKSGVYDASH
jgi:lysozyme